MDLFVKKILEGSSAEKTPTIQMVGVSSFT
jgi:hypothetical protein